MSTVTFNRSAKRCAFCRYWNGALGSMTIQVLPGGKSFTVYKDEKHSCFKKGRGMVTFAVQECPYFVQRYED